MHAPLHRGAVRARVRDVPGFTLIELLAVVAVIAILAGLLVPTVGAARTATLKARTRMQFGQWVAALEQFRQEYGYYPSLGTDGKLATAADTLRFVRTLTGRNPDGSAVAAAPDLNGNFKRIAFLAPGSCDLTEADGLEGGVEAGACRLLIDAFGNTEIGLLFDRNGDGVIKPADDGPVAAVHGLDDTTAVTPGESDLPAAGIRAGVLFYSAGRGASPADLVLSWR